MGKYRLQKPLVKTSLLLSAATVPLISVMLAPAVAQDVDLGTITLSGEVGEGDGFKPEQTSVGSRIESPLDELPLSVDVITPDVIEATNATRVQDVVTTTTGAAIGNQFGGISNSIILRGFDASVTDNGGPAAVSSNRQRDSAHVERIEVLSGPSTALFGFGPPGGVVNVISKTPQDERFFRFKSEISSSASLRQEFDFNSPLTADGTVKARLTGVIEGTDSFRFSDFSDETFPESRVSVSPSILFEPNDQLSFLLRADYTRDTRIFDRGIAIGLDGDPVSDIDDFLGDPSFDDFISENISASLETTYRFNSDWSITGTLSGNQNKRDGLSLEPEAFFENAAEISPILGFLLPQANSIARQIEFRDQETTEFSARVDLKGAFNTGRVSHEVVFSVDAYDNENDTINSGSGVLPPAEVITLADLGQATALTTANLTDDSSSNVDTETVGISFLDKLSFGESLHVLVGGRLDYLDQTSSTPTTADTELSVTEFSPRFGVVVKPFEDKGFSAFFSYGESFNANTALAVGGGFLDPREGRTFEAGVAYTFHDDRLTASLTAFDIEEENVPLSFDGTFSVPTTNSSKGVELSLKGAVTDNLNITANYTYVDSEIGGVNGTTINAAAGESLPGVPEHTLSLLANYQFDRGTRFEGLSLTGAVRYQSSRLLSNSATFNGFDLPSIELDSVVRVDVSGTYDLNERVRLQAGIQNLFDEDIILPSAGFGLGIPEEGRTVFASASFVF
ncbi:MAG: TonB-dependent receptor [Litoreibacter sp.]